MDEEEFYEEEPDFEDDFESQFQDELDMIQEMQEPAPSKVPVISKSKRKIKFQTPPEVSRYTVRKQAFWTFSSLRTSVCVLQTIEKRKQEFNNGIISIIVIFVNRSQRANSEANEFVADLIETNSHLIDSEWHVPLKDCHKAKQRLLHCLQQVFIQHVAVSFPEIG